MYFSCSKNKTSVAGEEWARKVLRENDLEGYDKGCKF